MWMLLWAVLAMQRPNMISKLDSESSDQTQLGTYTYSQVGSYNF